MEFVRRSIARGKTQAPKVNERIETQSRASVAYYVARPHEIDGRLRELDREWGVERWLQLNSAVLSLVGVGLAATRSRRWVALPLVVQSFFLQHGIQGWCPPLELLRRIGIRTLGEIEAERHALKLARGDFARVDRGDPDALVEAASRGPAPEEAPRRAVRLKPSTTRVPENTSSAVNDRIRFQMRQRVAYYAAHPELIPRRLAELDREWDVERIIEVDGPITSSVGLLLGAFRSRRWLAIPALAQSMMVLHALQGFFPLLPLLRRAGRRTEQEVSIERNALKALRGDFEAVAAERPDESPVRRADRLFDAAQPAT